MPTNLAAVNLQVRGFELNSLEERRIDRHLRRLAQRLTTGRDELVVDLNLEWHEMQRRVTARIIARSGHLGTQLVSDASAETADKAVRLASERILRQFGRRRRMERGVGSYSVPSRWFPERSRRSHARPGAKTRDAERANDES